MKQKIKTLLAASLITGSLLTTFAMADHFDWENWFSCVTTCQGSCSLSGICYEEEK